MDGGQVGGGQFLPLLIDCDQRPFPFQPLPKFGQPDLRPFAQKGPGDLQRQGQVSQAAADAAGLGVLGVAGLPDGLAGWVAQEEGERGGFRQDGHFHRAAAGGQLPAAGGEEHPAGQFCGDQSGGDGTGEAVRLLHIVQNQQGVGMAVEVAGRGVDLVGDGPVKVGRVEQAAQGGESLG